MELTRVGCGEFYRVFTPGCPGWHLYSSPGFIATVEDNADDIHFLMMGDSRPRLGIVLGERGGRLRSPFSAPFGGFLAVREVSVEHVDVAVGLLKGYGESHGMPVDVTLPPSFYSPSIIDKTASALMRLGRLSHADINYHYPLTQVDSVEDFLDRSARKNLRRACAQGFAVEWVDIGDTAGISRVYRVIEANRHAKGRHVAMSLEQVIATAPVADTAFFLLTLDGEDVAAAVVQTVTPGVGQVVYWGDRPGYSAMRPMNLLPVEVFKAMRARGFDTLDIGPSSLNGIPDYGLCAFKENLGCRPSLKFRFEI